MTDLALAYAATRAHIATIASGASEQELERRVPACPDWTAADLVRHVAGVAHDTAMGALEGVGGEEWTAAHISARKGKGMSEVLAELDQYGSTLEAVIPNIPRSASMMLIGDTVTHEHDLRGALERQGARDSEAIFASLELATKVFGRRLKDAGLSSVLVECEGFSLVAGREDAALSVTGETFELFRALTGRRTADEIRALEWDGDPEPYVALFPLYGMATEPLNE